MSVGTGAAGGSGSDRNRRDGRVELAQIAQGLLQKRPMLTEVPLARRLQSLDLFAKPFGITERLAALGAGLLARLLADKVGLPGRIGAEQFGGALRRDDRLLHQPFLAAHRVEFRP